MFSHNQLYVAILMVNSKKRLKILLKNEDDVDTNVVSNMVYREVLFLSQWGAYESATP